MGIFLLSTKSARHVAMLIFIITIIIVVAHISHFL